MRYFSAFIILFVSALPVDPSPAFTEVQTEKLSQAVTRATNQLAKGRTEEALYAAVPRTHVQAGPTQLALNRNIVRVNQPIKPVARLNVPYVNTRANVNATAHLNATRPPVVKPAAQFHAGNKYVSNSTTVSNQ